VFRSIAVNETYTASNKSFTARVARRAVLSERTSTCRVAVNIEFTPTSLGKDTKYFVCPSVCPLALLENHTAELHQTFCACCLWPWLGPLLTALRYVMYFRFSDKLNYGPEPHKFSLVRLV